MNHPQLSDKKPQEYAKRSRTRSEKVRSIPCIVRKDSVQFSSSGGEGRRSRMDRTNVPSLKTLEGWFGGNGKQEKAGSESSNPIALPGIIGKNRFQSFLHPLRRDQPKRDEERKLSCRVSRVWQGAVAPDRTRSILLG
ncbi:hypothetical protein NPIL_373761 [Nephila pilipes]|uniref:Uncharacterized protein n=1 Tax=Nephila pilipes TaxID=299642 RepID=A0A8X6TTZ6_NEPPI|nr:hypothetical protein NPIL_373761 [Nephila pilipes]